MDNLFTQIEKKALSDVAPLAVRMRPTTLDELEGQSDVLGSGSWLRGAIKSDSLSSVILFGPAGTGKTTLAQIISNTTSAHFTEVSAISGGVSDLRRVIDEASKRLTLQNMRTVLFVDEIHRFSRSQQDALLHAVEDRVVILIGATTENPYFEVNSALISRSRIVEFKTLSDEDIRRIIRRTLADERGLANAFALSAVALEALVVLSGGDARMALTSLELASELAKDVSKLDESERAEFEKTELYAEVSKTAQSDHKLSKTKQTIRKSDQSDHKPAQPGRKLPAFDKKHTLQDKLCISKKAVLEATPGRMLPYDKKGDTHYDVISAFIKSMRGSDADAAIYWLARMIEGGEDPKFIARRIMIFASEDIGNADPQALLIASAAFDAVRFIGYPECQLNLAQAVIYMALAPKSNSATKAIFAARSEIQNGPARQVPNHLRDRHRPGAENYEPYKYPHKDERGYVKQQYLPDGLARNAFYKPGERGWENYRSEAVKNDRDDVCDVGHNDVSKSVCKSDEVKNDRKQKQ